MVILYITCYNGKELCVFKECIYVKVKCSRYRPGVAQRVGRGIALHFHDRGTRAGWAPGLV